MTDLNHFPEKPTSSDLYESSHDCFQQARIMLENVPPTDEVSVYGGFFVQMEMKVMPFY